MPTFDDRDQVILDQCQRELDLSPGPRVGDFVRFSDGVERRITHCWGREDDSRMQTTDERFGPMSFYLGLGYCSYSGALRSGVKRNTLTLTGEKKSGRVWFFHHDCSFAHNGVDCEVSFRVYACSLPSSEDN